jgi:TetR/AcrR family transcriptional regulator, cholesterol catabolism regulator
MTDTDNKERIKLQATDLFMKYGVRSVSMDDIANNLGMSKKTIYQFYADKDELVEAMVQHLTVKNQQCCEEDRAVADNAIDEIFLVKEMMQEMFHTMNPSLVFDMHKYHPKAFSVFSKHKNEYLFNIIRKNLERGIEEELYRPEMNIAIVTRFRVESMMLPFNPEFHSSMKYSLVEIEDEVIDLFLFGLVTMKGYKIILKYKQERTKKTLSNAKIK